MNKTAVTKLQAAVVAAIVIVAVVAGTVYLYLYQVPKEEPMKEIKIGVLTPITGGYSHIGPHMLLAAKLAADEINAKGGILGSTITIVTGDTEGNPEKGVSAAKELILKHGAQFLIGVLSSSVAQAVTEVAADEKTIYICSNAAADEVTQAVLDDYNRYRYVFRTSPNVTTTATLYGISALDIFDPKTYMFIGTDYKYCRDVAAIAKIILEEQKGVQCLGDLFVGSAVTDFTSEIEKIRSSEPDLVLNFLLANHLYSFMTQYYTVKPPSPLLCTMSFYEKKIAREFPEHGDYVAALAYTHRAPITEKTIPFYEAFEAATGWPADGYGDVFYYDSVYILKDAIERAGSVETDKVIAALEETDYLGAAGTYQFTKAHQTMFGEGHIGGVIAQWYDEEAYVIWPPELKQADYRKWWT